MKKTISSYLYKNTVDIDYWEKYVGRNLESNECLMLRKTRNEQIINGKIYNIYEIAKKYNLYIPTLTKLDGNCIFESLRYYNLCDDISNFRKGLSLLMITFKNKKNFLPNEEMSLNELFTLYQCADDGESEFVFCKTRQKLYKYNFDTMCLDLSTDTNWKRLHTNLIFAVLTVLLNIRIHIISNLNNGGESIIEYINNEFTKDIYLGLIDQFHYFPLDTRRGRDDENECPRYQNNAKQFHSWAREQAVKSGSVEYESDVSSE